MGRNDHVNVDLQNAIQDLLDEGLLEEGTAGYGIALQIIERGFESLKGDQKRTYEKYVEGPLKKRHQQLEIQRVIDTNPE
ncbi:hypothetical protein ALQ47_03107 [Pseudomonas cichorii]|nr:hypothetical protein ALQ47_03107 [Pseudomonas cichorii]